MIVFARYPRPGSVKTRLAESIGDGPAAQFYKYCAEHLFDELRHLPESTHTYVYVADSSEMHLMRQWIGDQFTLRSQCDGDLGERMHRAFTEVFGEGITKAVVVGTDIPDLTADHILQSLRLLENHDVVLGPALDGGYYLLGMKSPHRLFEDVEWGTTTVAHATRQIIFKRGLSLTQLEMLEDVDTEEAYRRFQS